jgi:hypothetical protein
MIEYPRQRVRTLVCLTLVGCMSAMGSGGRPPAMPPESAATQPVLHELEVGWVASGLLNVLGLPTEGEAFPRLAIDYVRNLHNTKSESTEVLKLSMSALGGFDVESLPGLYLPRISIHLDSDRLSNSRQDRYSHVFSNALLAIRDDLKGVGETSPDTRRDRFRGIALVLASTDYVSPRQALWLVRDSWTAPKFRFTDEQLQQLKVFLEEASVRESAAGESMARFGEVLLRCRDAAKGAAMSMEEARMLVRCLSRVREVGVIDQGNWQSIALDIHSVLMYRSDDPTQQAGREHLIDYVTQWRDSLPECNARRWLSHALKQDPTVKPVRVFRAEEVFRK